MLTVEPLWYHGEEERPYGYNIRDESGRECRIAIDYDLWLTVEALSPEMREQLFRRVLDEFKTIRIGKPATCPPAENQDTR